MIRETQLSQNEPGPGPAEMRGSWREETLMCFQWLGYKRISPVMSESSVPETELASAE